MYNVDDLTGKYMNSLQTGLLLGWLGTQPLGGGLAHEVCVLAGTDFPYCLWDWVDNMKSVCLGEFIQGTACKSLRFLSLIYFRKPTVKLKGTRTHGMFDIIPTLEMGMQSSPGASREDSNCKCWKPRGYNYLGVKLRFRDWTLESSSLL